MAGLNFRVHVILKRESLGKMMDEDVPGYLTPSVRGLTFCVWTVLVVHQTQLDIFRPISGRVVCCPSKRHHVEPLGAQIFQPGVPVHGCSGYVPAAEAPDKPSLDLLPHQDEDLSGEGLQPIPWRCRFWMGFFVFKQERHRERERETQQLKFVFGFFGGFPGWINTTC